MTDTHVLDSSAIESHIDALVESMTLEEQVSLLAGADFWTTVPVERVGVPAIKVSDGPNGARGGGSLIGGVSAAAFPVGISLASTWNTPLVEEVGQALAEEALSKGARVLLGPTINIHRSPLNGRNFECYSEDPYLSARLAVAYVRGLQSQGVGATVKHYVGNDSEFERNSISSDIGERALREIYLVPFEAAVKEGGAWALMSAYNKINGIFACDNRRLLHDVLKGEWGFDGLVTVSYTHLCWRLPPRPPICPSASSRARAANPPTSTASSTSAAWSSAATKTRTRAATFTTPSSSKTCPMRLMATRPPPTP